jgi:hypothetical protein
MTNQNWNLFISPIPDLRENIKIMHIKDPGFNTCLGFEELLGILILL